MPTTLSIVLLTVHCEVYTIILFGFYFCMMIDEREIHKAICLDSLEKYLMLPPSGFNGCLAMVLDRFLFLVNITRYTYSKSFPLTKASKSLILFRAHFIHFSTWKSSVLFSLAQNFFLASLSHLKGWSSPPSCGLGLLFLISCSLAVSSVFLSSCIFYLPLLNSTCLNTTYTFM